jgi:hypothetical protein
MNSLRKNSLVRDMHTQIAISNNSPSSVVVLSIPSFSNHQLDHPNFPHPNLKPAQTSTFTVGWLFNNSRNIECQ